MRKSLAILLAVTVLFGLGYRFYVAQAVCHVPISYRIGAIDPRFNLTPEQARAAASVAESLWEDATGRNLFTYDDKASMAINFVYDDRQANSELEASLQKELDDRQQLSDDVSAKYQQLLTQYGELKDNYESRKADYDERLKAHNTEVEKWNNAGGAPEDVYQDLLTHQQELKDEQEELNTIAYHLNQLVKEMNKVGAQGNSLIENYNQIVQEYNTRFSKDQEFTQGEYKDGTINVYEFGSQDELEIVIAHEFGHALSLNHVDSSSSIMFHLMDQQSTTTGVTAQDKAEFERVCGTGGFTLGSIL